MLVPPVNPVTVVDTATMVVVMMMIWYRYNNTHHVNPLVDST
jgi:hypothetical protein